VTDKPDDMPPYRHIEKAEMLLLRADQMVSENMRAQTGESKTDVLLAALTHAVIAVAKMVGRQRA